MAEHAIPSEVRDWIDQLRWGEHHVEWHTVRQWDTLSPAQRQDATDLGWHRAAIQEGESGNGFEFLLMHRAMLQLLRENFPQFSALWLGWVTVPTDPDDVNDPVPTGVPRTFDADKKDGVDRIQGLTPTFADDDDFGRYVETRRRPVGGNPFAQSTDRSTGVHNYLHNRFSVSGSPIDMGDPAINLSNVRFWRLHGWIDTCWSAFRASKGLSDSDPAFQHALNAEKSHLLGHMPHPMHRAAPGAAMAAAGRAAARVLPAALRRPFADTLALRFQRLMASAPTITTLDELKAYLQTAVELELYTLPLYLTAKWSLITTDPAARAVAQIITKVGRQEMLHMGLAANLLVSVGGHPVIASPSTAPKFPSQPPGIDLPEIDLRPFSEDRIQQFLQIEMPENGPIPPTLLTAAGAVPRFHTIGEFYDIIDQGLTNLAGSPGGLTLSGTGQLIATLIPTGTNELVVIDTLDKAHSAIRLIKEQGEGTSASQGAVDYDGDLAHYYAFQQIVLQKKYARQSDGTFKLDPSSPLPLPSSSAVYPMAPVPAGGYPGNAKVEAFDKIYSRMLDKLQMAWDTGYQDLLTGRGGAVDDMLLMRAAAQAAMNDPLPVGGGNYGPDFRYIPAPPLQPVPAAAPASGAARFTAGGPAATPPPEYARIKAILDEAVNYETFGAHGPFWRGLSRDDFVGKVIFGLPVIATTASGTFDPDESNLVKALEGRVPFGADLATPPAGAIYNRMPDGYPSVPQDRIDEIRAWITAGCPGSETSTSTWVMGATVSATTGMQHVEFWRDLDDWSMYHASTQARDDINTFFAVAPRWLAAAKDPAQLPAWRAALMSGNVQQAVARLESRQRATVTSHYGRPVVLSSLLESFEQFGDDSLPDDSVRPADPRHRMNGAIMWFLWSAFCDACLQIGTTAPGIPLEFWTAMARALLLGLINDGLFRGRFHISGFSADQAGKQAMRQFVERLTPAHIAPELAARYRDSGL